MGTDDGDGRNTHGRVKAGAIPPSNPTGLPGDDPRSRHGDIAAIVSDPAPTPASRIRRFCWKAGRRVALLIIILVTLRLTGCMERLFYAPQRGPTPPPIGAEGVWFRAADGTRLFGWWLPAAGHGPDDPPAPTVIHVHGNAGNLPGHEFFSEHLPPAGFNVFLFDYRGYGQSEGSARSRDALIADTHAALDTVLARRDVDPARIALYGHSLGGAIACNVAADRMEVAALVLESPFDSWRNAAATAIGGDPPFFLAKWLAWVLIADHRRPDDALHRYRGPVLILHGEADTIVPPGHGRRLAARAGDRAELHLYPGGVHNELQATHPRTRKTMIEFLRRHLHVGGI